MLLQSSTPYPMRLQPFVQQQLRTFTSSPSLSAKPRPTSRFGPTVSLDHFLQRAKAISLWRDIVRGTNRIADEKMRKEARDMARVEFERNRGVADITQIRYLISTGKTQWQSMERYIDGL